MDTFMYPFLSYQKGEIFIENKTLEKKNCNNVLAYSMKLALLNELLRLNKITEQEYSLIRAKIKLEHKIV